ncbi:hypothetical protein DQP56_02475 [Mycolicibacter senuensis]|nr:hypothetical protein DQP56_02475 [Mycolicibacter senuensis]
MAVMVGIYIFTRWCFRRRLWPVDWLPSFLFGLVVLSTETGWHAMYLLLVFIHDGRQGCAVRGIDCLDRWRWMSVR